MYKHSLDDACINVIIDICIVFIITIDALPADSLNPNNNNHI